MSYGAFVQANIDERHAQSRKLTAAEQAREDRYRRAYEIVVQHCPSLTDGRGGACPWAVWAVLDLQRAGRPIKPAAIQSERRRRLDAHKARWGTDPTKETAA